jgi:hypothetical protein
VDERIDTQRALIWLVLGPPQLDVADLEGRFVRKNATGLALEGRFRNGLIGEDGAIALVPPSGREQIAGNAALTVVDLNLSALRT